MELKQAKISDLKFDNKNANKHTEQGNRLLERSLSKLGFGRSVLLDKDNNIIAGNGVTEKAGELGFDKVRIIETDGTEIIAVKRKDVSINSKKGRELAIADNQTAKAGIEFDLDVLEDLRDEFDVDFGEWELEPFKFEEGGGDETEGEDNTYTKEIKSPVYEPKGEKPPVNDLYDEKKTNKLIKAIKDSGATKEEKEFLIAAARRHTVFTYSKIADFYAHSNAEIQNLMEMSALVIIDFDKAIEMGYVKLTEEIAEYYGTEYGKCDE